MHQILYGVALVLSRSTIVHGDTSIHDHQDYFRGPKPEPTAAGLDAAIHCGWPHGGWCPKGRKAEDGVIPANYCLNEMASAEYLPRTKANVFDSDATVIFTYGPPTGGSLQTMTYAHHLEKPYHEVDLSRTTQKNAIMEIMLWLAGDEELNDYDEYVAFPPPLECVLNVAGSTGKAMRQGYRKSSFT